MTLILGARCRDGVILAADRRRLARYEKGPSTTKVFQLSCGVVLAGAGDDAVLYEARVFIDRRIKGLESEPPVKTLFDVVEITASIVNELVSYYKDRVEESFGYALAGLENLRSGSAKLYTVFGAGFSDIPSACLGSGSSYARPLVELLLADGNLQVDEAVKTLPTIFSLVSNVQTTVGDGMDISMIRDGRGIDRIRYEKEVSLDRLKAAILGAFDFSCRR